MNQDAPVRGGLLALLGEGFFSRLSFGLISFALPLYARKLGFSLSELGLLLSVNTAVGMLCKPLMGTLADRLGWRRCLLAGIALRSLTSLLFMFACLPWQLFGVRALRGLSQSLRNPPVNALLAECGGKHAAASAFAWYATAKTAAASIGSAAAGVLLAQSGSDFELVFIAAFAVSAAPLLLVWRYVEEPRGREAPARPRERAAAKSSAPQERPGLLPIAGLGALMSGTAHMLRGLFPVLATEYAGLNTAQTGLIYLASTLLALTAGPMFGWLSDHVSREGVLLVRGAANICSSAIYLAAPGFAGVTAAKLADDLGKAAFRPAWGAMMSCASSHDASNRAHRMALMSLGEDAGELVGPALAGLLWSGGGIVALMGTRIALAALTEAYAMALARRLEPSASAAPAE